MQRFLKQMAALAVMVSGIQLSHGFALLGPFEAYQVPNLAYYPGIYTSFTSYGGLVALGDLGGPHNIAEEFRRNTPVLYYSFDEPFLSFFGSNGVAAVDQAFNLMNTLTNVSAYSSDLSEFPQRSQEINFEAQEAHLTDVKSMTLHYLMEQMGLSEPERFAWAFRARAMGTPCPFAGSYLVTRRNFDVGQTPLGQTVYSSYVNGVLYTYGIVEYCTGTPVAEILTYAVDPLSDTYLSVAANPGPQRSIFQLLGNQGINLGGSGLRVGGFYNYITQDDMAGLRYLLSKDNYNWESSGPGTVQFVTNNTAVLLTNEFDLGLLAAQAPTNSAATLQALYPGLVVDDTTNWFQLVWATNISLVVTSSPFAPPGLVNVVAVTNRAPTVVEYFGHTFGNIITNFNTYSKRSVYRIQTISPGNQAFAPAGSAPTLVTNTSTLLPSHQIAGSFFLLPTNLCAIKIIQSLYTNVIATTNTTFSLTQTNTTTGSNQTYTVNIISYFTNNWLVYLPVTCPQDTIGLRQGVERIQFKRRDFDSLVGRFWEPATNRYTLNALTNNSVRPQLIERVVTRPDFLFTAQDQAGANTFNGTIFRDITFSRAVTNGLAGPGTITTPSTVIFNKLGDSYWNLSDINVFESSLWFISEESSQIQGLLWGSFDGTTNTPVVYPNGTSLANLVNQFVLRVTNQPAATIVNGVAELPSGARGSSYDNTFSVSGGVQPYSWSIAPGSAGLPGSLSFVTITNTGESIQISGTLTAAPATYDFSVRVTDSASRFVDVPYSLTIY